MKKYTIIILSFLFICLFFAYGLNAQHGIVVFGKDTLCINNINLDNISHSEDGVSIVCNDTILTRNVVDVDSISIMKIPECIVIEQGIDDWSEMRLCSDGTVALTKMKNENTPIEMMMMCPNDSLGAVFSKITFDENAYPVDITMNEYRMLVDWIDETQFNLTILSPDSIAYRVDSLTYTVEQRVCGKRLVPDINKKPWMTRLGGVLEMVGGIVAIAGGGILIYGSGAEEIGSAGISTPISTTGIAVGIYTVKSGIESTFNGIINTFTNDYVNGLDPIINTLTSQAAITTFEKGVVPKLPDKQFPFPKDIKCKPNDLFSLIPTFLGDVISNIEKPYTWFDLVKDVQENILTGLSKNITQISATTRGYINPYILESPSVKFETEYGMIVYSATNSKERYIQKDFNGDGGMIEYNFSDLKPNTTYNYFTYYIDKTNNVLAVAKEKSFTTLAAELPVIITHFKQTGSYYKENGYSYNGKTYSYKYDVTVTVELIEPEGVADWGYVYEDPNGKIARISLKGFSSPYPDDRYIYYRNEDKSTVRLYEYVKYEGSEEYEYGEPVDYVVQMAYHSCPDNNHPHLIDLGLPSGTMWACCNVGASTPEGYGGYYAWGETEEKSFYSIATYKYVTLYVDEDNVECYDYIHIGDDIAGTEYDVANVKCGGEWRMPTRDQQIELEDDCSWKWTTQNGVNGMLVTGPNGGRIFLPAAGYRYNAGYDDHLSEGEFGYYWSSSLVGFESFAFGLTLFSSNWGDDFYRRSDGCSVRPVCP